ncbi:oxygenase MpaB family protein [Bradyrhizobium sp. SSUT18]|uniref:oxygenase MpaB family protein n=1 Tax=unclassified Bradyrhizobium TaxID=2631580 RepID=UPI002449C1B6|nr:MULTISPECIES: oxygenase MpaB family protein [unclassified Bradyrhizobium]MDH2355451.1 oxygenase MpaB family protein [Bradyrhizobium sp. SSUT112]MDH2403974.1 oxygenase MpaB family protein [Bradyrhizobium sp. SSUT18]
MVVEKDLAAALDQVRANAAGPVPGVFGPSSVTWQIDREAVIFLGAGRALLLQLAHPWVAVAIAEHSRTLADPIGRFHRTFDIVFSMVFGSLDRALLSSRQLHRRHSMIIGEMPETVGPFAAGSRYCANDIPSLRWVHATLVETALMAHDLVLPPLSAEERERYWTESRAFGALFGLTADDLPADWSGFAAYTAAMTQSDTLTVSPAAREIARQIFGGARPWLRVPRWYRSLTASLLPEPLRAGFGLELDERNIRSADNALRWIRRVYPKLPDRLRYVGPYQEAQARLRGELQPDWMTRCLNRVWIGRPQMDHRR